MTSFEPIPGARALDRRAFLRSSLVIAASLVATACTPRRSQPPALSVFSGGMDFVAGVEQRYTFGLTGGVNGFDPTDPVGVAVRTADGVRREVGTSVFHRFALAAGEGDPIGYHRVTLPPLPAGITDVEVSGSTGSGAAVIEVRDEPLAPGVGQLVEPIATPTRADPRGYEQVCTRTPGCGLHQQRLDTLLGRGPLVLVVGSPLLCDSRTCGPVLDEIVEVAASTEGVRFLHVEPYTELNTISIGPIMRRWNLPSEPWTFVIDESGRVASRFEGPVTAEELRPAVLALAPIR